MIRSYILIGMCLIFSACNATSDTITGHDIAGITASGATISKPLRFERVEASHQSQTEKRKVYQQNAARLNAKNNGLSDDVVSQVAMDAYNRIPNEPFGEDQDRWLDFKSNAQSTDTLHLIQWPKPSDFSPNGPAYVLIRDNRVIATFLISK